MNQLPISHIKRKDEAVHQCRQFTQTLLPDISPDTRVFIKPNICSPKRPASGTTTHHEVVRGVLEALRHVREVCIIESHTNSSDFEENLKGWDPSFLRDFPNTSLVNLSLEPTMNLPVRGIHNDLYNIEFARCLSHCDLLINLPVLKVHIHAGFSVGMKNLFGLISTKHKSRYHLDIHDVVYGVNKLFPPALTIIDGLEGMQGMGPLFGEPAHAGVLMAGTDVAELDSAAANYIGINPENVFYLKSMLNGRAPRSFNDFQTTIFDRYPTLPSQFVLLMQNGMPVTLDELKAHIHAPQQTLNNLSVFMDVMCKRGYAFGNADGYRMNTLQIEAFIKRFPEADMSVPEAALLAEEA